MAFLLLYYDNRIMQEQLRQSKKAGLPPGSLVHIGKKITEKPFIFWLKYDSDAVAQGEGNALDILPQRSDTEIVWIDFIGINHIDVIESLGKDYGLHPLVLEDIVNTEQRPKFEEFTGYTFFTLKHATYTKLPAHINLAQVSIVFGKNFVLTFREEETDLFETIRKRLLSGASRARKKKSDFLVYLIIDSIVDGYFDIMDCHILFLSSF